METFKRTLIMLALVAVFILSLVSTYAVEATELQAEVDECIATKSVAHQMAECARKLGYAETHTVIQCAQEKWWRAHNRQLELEKQIAQAGEQETLSIWTGPKLTRSKGVNWGPTGKETYYNLPMGGVVRIMRNMGFSESEYPYWVRSDGAKMLGDYVMVAANLSHFPRGSIVQCSLGAALVCDTGGFASRKDGWNWLDIATNW